MRELNRRSFLKSIVVTGGIAAVASLTGCSTKPDPNQDGGDTSQETNPTAQSITPSESINCQLCVIGAGLSGLAACVQAGELGINVVALESTDAAGGGARMGVEGSFGINSAMAKVSGVEVDQRAILKDELSQAQQRNNALLWKDLFDVAGENIDWLVKNGVEFSGIIDNYHTGKFNTFHWYKNGHASEGYVPQMSAKAEELGVNFIFNTTAKRLIQDDAGKVIGVYAERNDGSWIQVNADAIILSSGGFGSNPEIVARIGYEPDRLGCMFEAAQGYGYQMAIAAGAKDTIPGCCDQNAPMIGSLPKGQTNMLFCMEPKIPWINEECERFYAEDIVVSNMSYSNPPKWNQKDYFIIFDQKIVDDYSSWGTDSTLDFPHQIDAAVQSGDGSVYRCNTIEELAACYDLNTDALVSCIEDYNRMCAAGDDEFFGKDPQYLQAIENGPFYIARPMWVVFCVVGGIGTNRNTEVIDDHFNVIPGLYAVGNDGCMLYRNIYTIDTPGTCSGWGIASGRKAVQHAYENYISA
ncbi:FAD-dependent oxidoreductase [Adlercreutzia sp. ZJ141]|uniref:FAD-dependent oxidoreductase n=1 Tax=Adlercreutzia sp. ZJ141 TaxID=2709406 RepID=UPI0013EC454C|nr:FAD-binding protein [Adlercreutzia sp. ZJ141]